MKLRGPPQHGGSLVLAVAAPGGNGVDRLRIIIRDSANQVVYDNRLGTAEDMDQAYPLSMANGSIVVHH